MAASITAASTPRFSSKAAVLGTESTSEMPQSADESTIIRSEPCAAITSAMRSASIFVCG